MVEELDGDVHWTGAAPLPLGSGAAGEVSSTRVGRESSNRPKIKTAGGNSGKLGT